MSHEKTFFLMRTLIKIGETQSSSIHACRRRSVDHRARHDTSLLQFLFLFLVGGLRFVCLTHWTKRVWRSTVIFPDFSAQDASPEQWAKWPRQQLRTIRYSTSFTPFLKRRVLSIASPRVDVVNGRRASFLGEAFSYLFPPTWKENRRIL